MGVVFHQYLAGMASMRDQLFQGSADQLNTAVIASAARQSRMPA
jgi:hypothetical protein